MATDDHELQKEYKRLLNLLHSLVYQLKDPKDSAHCLLWLTKLGDASIKERPLRNQLLEQLLENVASKQLEYPFTEDPFEGPLQDVFKDKPRTTYDSIDPNPSVRDYSMDSGISKYRQRSKQHKETISQCRGVMKNMMQMIPKTSVFDVPPIVPRLKLDASCSECDNKKKVQPKNPDQTTSLLLRIKNLESKTQDLEIKCSNVESTFKANKKKRSGSKVRCKQQIQRLVTEKDNTITKLKEEINHLMSSESLSHFENIYHQKYNELENKYQQIVQDMADAHSKELKKNLKTIETLQNRMAGNSP